MIKPKKSDAPKRAASHWSSMTEEQLLLTSFTTDNPEGLDGLVETVPPETDQPPFVEYWYDFRGSKRSRVRCVHCRWNNHKAGYVICTGEGQRFLVGHDCGDKLYGAHFEALKQDYTDARDHANDVRRWRNLQAALPDFLEWLSDLQRCEAVRLYRDTKKKFRSELPRLFGAIAVALLHDRGVLSIEEQLRDFDAENRAVDRYERKKQDWEQLTATERKHRKRYEGEKAPQPPHLPIFKYLPKPLMTVRADTFFLERQLPHEQLARALTAFQDLAAKSPERPCGKPPTRAEKTSASATEDTCSLPPTKVCSADWTPWWI
jgi:hypothetical protein